jgi:hypothetical protein
VPLHHPSAYQIFKTTIENSPDIVSIAGTQSNFGHAPHFVDAETENRRALVWRYSIGTDYLKTMGVAIVEGRHFKENLKSDQEQSIIVNTEFCKVFGLDAPLGKRVSLFVGDAKKTYFVIGVINDFRVRDVDEPIEPAVLINTPPTQYSTMAVQFAGDRFKPVMADLKEKWRICFPNLPFQGWSLETIRAHEVHIANAVSTAFFYISIITMIIIAMGLFALIALNIEKRTKEIAVRKILGASLVHISKLLMKESFFLFLFSICVAAALGTYLLSIMLQSMWKEYIGLDALPVIVAAAMIIAIAATTLAVNLLRIHGTNPVDALRYE